MPSVKTVQAEAEPQGVLPRSILAIASFLRASVVATRSVLPMRTLARADSLFPAMLIVMISTSSIHGSTVSVPHYEFSTTSNLPFWPMYGNDAEHTSRASVAGPASTPQQVWFTPLETSFLMVTPVSVSGEGTIYASSGNGIVKINPSDGTVVPFWNLPGWMVYSIAIQHDGSIIAGANYHVGSGDEKGAVYAISPGGDLEWTVPLDGLAYNPVTLGSTSTNVYASGAHGSLYAISETGQVLWTRQGSASYGGVALDQSGDIIYATETNLTSYQPDGSVNWTVNMWADSQVVIGDGTLFVTGYECTPDTPYCSPVYPRAFFALDLHDGSVRWSKDTPYPEGHVSVGSEVIFMGYEGEVNQYAYDGTVRWSTSLDTPALYTGGIVDGNNVYYLHSNNGIDAVDNSGHLVWQVNYSGYPVAFNSQGILYYYNSTGIGALAYPDFTISGFPAGSASTIVVRPTNGFDGEVDLTLSFDQAGSQNLSQTGLSCTLSKPTITGGLGNSSIACSSATAGSHTIYVTGKSANLVHTARIDVQNYAALSPNNVFGLSQPALYVATAVLATLMMAGGIVVVVRRRKRTVT